MVFFFVLRPATSDAKDKPRFLRNTSYISSQFIPSLSATNLSISATKTTVEGEKLPLSQEIGAKMQPPPEK